jgi:magnesium-protoporphyrin O-methyltransferase
MTAAYLERRGQIKHYFDRTAADAWARLTSDAKVSRIRANVRAGRERMRATLLSWLPADLHGCRILDAGCGTGAFALEAARRGARVVAIDLSPTLIGIARQRLAEESVAGAITLLAGDMLSDQLGHFDYVVAMDSLIHYRAADVATALNQLAPRCSTAMLFTFAPKTPLLSAMHGVGKLFPRGDRAPSIVPVGEGQLRILLAHGHLRGFSPTRTERVASGFYTSQAMELIRQ